MKSGCLTMCAAGLLLAGCGGGGGDDTAPPAAGHEVPAAASASPEALAQWMGSLAASDDTEPLVITGFEPPVSDTDEPVALR